MKRMSMFLFAAVAANAILPARGGDSAPFLLDTADGTRIATEGEAIPIAYSPRWGNAASCTVTESGRAALVAAATSEGTTTWTPQGTGGHTLTHTAGSTTYTAQFAVLGDDVETHGGTILSNETWGTNKVHLVVAPITLGDNDFSHFYRLEIQSGAIVKFMPGTGLSIESNAYCSASGAIFTHVNDDTIGGDTLMDGDSTSPVIDDYAVSNMLSWDDTIEFRYRTDPNVTLSGTISSGETWRGHNIYCVTGNLTVASGATLTIMPGAIVKFAEGKSLTVNSGAMLTLQSGTILKFGTGCSLTVNGFLDAQGTRAAPIVFTSLKDDAHGGDTNGDGEKTYAQAGDWYQISVPGTANFNYCHVLYNSSTENTGAIDARGGTVNFDNSEIAHTKYECVNAHNSGYFTARNSIFRDSSLGFGYYGSGRVKAYNCVFADLTAGIRQSGKTLVNCVFYRCLAFTDQSGDGSTFKNCVFYNPSGYGAQSYSKCGSNGNIWDDPLFVDPDNGDFRIAANSPCVDAGDGTVAPATDYWGQPRMDVKAVADTGTPNSDGVCPDIGIYEVPGTAPVPLPDLAVVSVATSATLPLAPGDSLAVTYTVTNRGAAAVSGLVRDLFRFTGADAATAGLTVDAAEIEQAYSVPTGGCATLTATVTVPMLKAGKWKVGVMVNSGRVPYEAVIANNFAEADEMITVAVEPFAVGESKDVEIPVGGVVGAAVVGLPATGGAIVAALPKGVVFYASAGYVPDETRHDAAGVLLADGRTALFIPAHEEGETVYVTLVNDSRAAQTVALAALASGDGLEVAKPADVAVTAKGPKVTAKLVLPESVRDGRVYAAWVEYSNSGDEDAELPIFTVSRTGGGATLSATAKGTYSANPLSLVGLAPSAPRGKLKPGEAGRVAFYFMSSGNLSLKLGMVTEKSTSVLNGFATVAEYRAGMSAAATRLCARGGAEPGFTEVLAQALNEKRGAGGAAVCGTLRHSATKMPMTGVEVHLVLTNDSSVVDAVLTDANGHFTLTADDAGDYAVDVRDVFSHAPCIVSLAVGEDTPVSLSAVPLSSVSGVVGYSGTAEIAVGATVVLDDLSTADAEDRVAETDESGMYSFGGLADGEYRLSLYPFEGYALVESDAFSVSNGVPVSRNLSYGAKGRVVSGVVADVETGAVVSNAVVMLSRGGTSLGVTTDGGGRFKFDGIAAGRWGLTLEAPAHQVDGVSEIVVEDGAGEQRIDIPARAKCPFAVLRPVGMVPHKATFSVLREGVDSLEWDFDGDGVADSTSETPEWTYSAAGTYSVALSYTDGDGVRRRSQWTDAVKVVAPFENVLKPNGVLVSEADGVAVESVSETELALSGSPVSAWASPGTVLGAETSSKGGFIRRVVSSENLGGGRWRFTVEKAGLADLYEQYFMSGDIALSAAKARKLMAARLASASRSGSGEEVSHGAKVVVPEREADNSFTLPTLSYTPLFSDASASITGSFEAWNGDAVKGSYGALVSEGRVLMTWYSATDTYKATVTASASYTKDWTKGLTGKEPFSKTWNQSWADIPIGWGFSLSLQTDEDLKFSIEGSGTVTVEQSFMARRTQMFFFDEDGELDSSTTTDWGATTSTKRSIAGSISPTLDASLTLGLYGSFAKFVGRAGGGPKVGAKLSVTQSLGIGVENSFSAGSSGVDFDMAPIVESKLELGFTPYVGVNVSWKWLNIPKAKKYDVDLPLKMEWPNTANVGKMGMSTAGDGLTVTFTAQNPKIEATGWIFKDLLGLDGVEVPADKFLWGLGDGSLLQEGRTVTHTYAKEGRYKIRLFGESPIPATLITYTGSPFVRTSVKWIEVFDDKPPEPQDSVDTGNKTPKQSCDPNEMDGPDGVGEERYVKPGEWMTYTVYFENKSDADVPAQEVRVTNPLSEWLDWSTFEMCDIAFCNQVETGLAGKQNGTITVGQNDTAYKVQATVALNGDNGVVEWHLRSLDPARADFNYWPPDGEGLLPPNDATHRGEGHLTYRVKVRDDAPANVKIVNSATIVFDYNDPIETEPNWTNTVAQVASVKVNGDVEGEVADLDLIVGMPYGELPTPKARAGHTFAGWYTGPSGTGRRVTAQSLVEPGDSRLYAYWLAHAYTVHFEPNGGEGTMSDQAFEFDKEDELDANAFTRKFYLFTGWATNETGEAVFGDSAVVTNLTAIDHSTVTLYATWRYNAVEVSFDAQGGTPVPANSLYELDAPYGELPELTRSGFTFGGWYTGPNGTGRRVTVQDHAQADVTKLYAHWLAHAYTVRFHANGGTGLMSDQAFEFDKPTALDANAFTRQGFSFAGWATNATGVAVYADGVEVRNLTDVDGGVVTLYATWTVNSYTVTFDANGGVGGWSREMEYGAEIHAPTVTREGYTFAGWQPVLLGTVPANDVTFTAQWEISEIVKPDPGPEPDPEPVAEETPRLWTEVTGAAPSAATTYEGYLYDASGNVKGTIQVKVGKPNKKTGLAAVKATVIGTDGKKKTLKAAEKGKAQIAGDGPTTIPLAGGDACEVILGAKGMGGTYGAYVIDGSLNVFASKDAADKSVAAGVLGKWKGTVNVAWRLAGDGSPYQTLSVTIAAKGKAKVAGTLADGTKVSAKGQLVVGEEWCCVPVVVAKKAKLAFAVWLPLNEKAAGTAAPHGAAAPVVVGLDDAIAGKPGTLKAGAAFRLGGEMGDATYEAYLPNGVPVTGGAKWTLPKAGKVQQAKDGTVDAAKLGENPSALKLTYKAKDGTFKGSFKAYADVGGKPKGTTVKVTGVLVGGTGYGAATVKGGGGVAVTVE